MAKKELTEAEIADSIPDLWLPLTDSQRTFLAENFTIQKYRKNEKIYCEGETPTHLMCLLRGKVKIYKDGVGGRCQIIRVIQNKEYFAYRAYFAEGDFVTAAAAIEPCTICQIPMNVICRLIMENNQLAMFFIKQLSKDLGLPFVDLEKIITKRMNLSAREIFERFGEPYYRALETLALKQLIQDRERKVISLGAGLPLQEQNEKYLKELGTIVYLKGSLATLKKRLEGSKKDPMLDGEDRDDKIKKLLKQRDPVYEKFADIQVTTGEVPFEELIKEIEEKLSTYEKK